MIPDISMKTGEASSDSAPVVDWTERSSDPFGVTVQVKVAFTVPVVPAETVTCEPDTVAVPVPLIDVSNVVLPITCPVTLGIPLR
jgi:hypothetical protein